jgi:hypothetical protein
MQVNNSIAIDTCLLCKRSADTKEYIGEEASVSSDYHSGTAWAPVGKTPVVESTGVRFSVNMISAVSAKGQLRFMAFNGKWNWLIKHNLGKTQVAGPDQFRAAVSRFMRRLQKLPKILKGFCRDTKTCAVVFCLLVCKSRL